MDRHFLTTRLIAHPLAAFGILLIMILGNELWSRSEATFTHGFCPECVDRQYGAYRDAAK